MNRPAQRRRTFRPKTFALVFVASLCLAACSAGVPPDARRYELKGKILSVDLAKGTVFVDHEEIKGYMAAMTMDFPVRDAEALKAMEPGQSIQATLAVADDAYWLENTVLTKTLPAGPVPASPSAGAREPQPGDEIPAVKLVNQDGRPLDTRGFKGRALVVTFVYTRCPLPDQCPLLSANFARLNAALAADPALAKRARLLSVTLDPEYDKPEVLKSYGAAYAGGKFDGWDFATGDPAEVRRFAEFFGLVYKAEGGQVTHSLRTALVAPDGRLYKIYRGNEWKPEEVLNDLRSLPAA
ncbi:MAG TPA: SCO family protein [Pyrinomonadaceae bacterium]|jgi:protein SCO1/2